MESKEIPIPTSRYFEKTTNVLGWQNFLFQVNYTKDSLPDYILLLLPLCRNHRGVIGTV